MILELLKNILAPKKCQSCRREGAFLCNKCFAKQNNFSGFCYICKRKSKKFNIHKKCIIENKLLSGKNFNNMKVYFHKIIVLTHYNNTVIKKLIKKFKFFGKKDIGLEFGIKMGELLEKNIDIHNREDCIILPVPMNIFRRVSRGYNQSDILAETIANHCNVCYNKNILIRKRHTRQQAKLSQQERVVNLEDAFKISKKLADKVDKKIIILVDDVISTGSTVNEISKLLKQHGASKVVVLCLASN